MLANAVSEISDGDGLTFKSIPSLFGGPRSGGGSSNAILGNLDTLAPISTLAPIDKVFNPIFVSDPGNLPAPVDTTGPTIGQLEDSIATVGTTALPTTTAASAAASTASQGSQTPTSTHRGLMLLMVAVVLYFIFRK